MADNITIQNNNSEEIPNPTLPYWRVAQTLLLAVGVILVFLLFFLPDIGVTLFWNLIIPVAPLLLILIPGVWRNICPMASVGLLPFHMSYSKRQPMPDNLHVIFTLVGIALLLIIVPLRHLYFNLSGPLTGAMLVIAAAAAFAVGLKYKRKSAWCSALCPIHPVEKLYGLASVVTAPNAHCKNCVKCWTPCPDSVKAIRPSVAKKNSLEKNIGLAFCGGFFGFILGWYQVPDYTGALTLSHFVTAFAWPFGGFAVSLLAFIAVYTLSPKKMEMFWIRLFATAAISCYYWYRIPMLVGLGPFPGQGMLVDLSGHLPEWFSIASQLSVTCFFTWFIMIRPNKKRSWLVRPEFQTTKVAENTAG